MNKNDLRYQKTEKNIRAAFLACIEELGFEKTTVAHICARGMMSRNTFYAHYQDKYALLSGIYREVGDWFSQYYTTPLIQAQLCGRDISQSLEHYIRIVAEHHQLFRTLLKCPTAEFEDILCRSIVLSPMEQLICNLDELTADLKVRLNLAYMFHAMIRFTQLWLDHYDDITTGEAARELGELCLHPTRMFLEKVLDSPKAVWREGKSPVSPKG